MNVLIILSSGILKNFGSHKMEDRNRGSLKITPNKLTKAVGRRFCLAYNKIADQAVLVNKLAKYLVISIIYLTFRLWKDSRENTCHVYKPVQFFGCKRFLKKVSLF